MTEELRAATLQEWVVWQACRCLPGLYRIREEGIGREFEDCADQCHRSGCRISKIQY